MLEKWKLTVDDNEAFGDLLTSAKSSRPTNCKISFLWFIINISKIAKRLFIKSQTTNKSFKSF